MNRRLLSFVAILGTCTFLCTSLLAKEPPTLRPGPMEPFGEKVQADTALKVGQALQASWKGKWWLASVVEVQKDGKVKIHYYGWAPKWDEVVSRDKLLYIKRTPGPVSDKGVAVTDTSKLKPGDPVKVSWKAKWWLASVLEVQADGKVKIRYFGFSHSWDEAVTVDRLKVFLKKK